MLSFNNGFDEDSEEIDAFGSDFIKHVRRELNEILEKMRNGEIEGTWKVRQIDEPGMNGYVIQGRFESGKSSDPLEPLKPLKRRPLPERPFDTEPALSDTREPLTDIFEEENAVKIYVELPGEEKDDIKLNIKENKVEIKAKNFSKTVCLPEKPFAIEDASSEHKNGVLMITIPKKKENAGKLKKN